MRVLEAVILSFFLFSPVSAEECSCTEIETVFNFVTVNDADIDYMEDFPWRFDHCDGKDIFVTLVYEDDPELDSYTVQDDGNVLISFMGEWVRFDQFAQRVKSQCQVALNS